MNSPVEKSKIANDARESKAVLLSILIPTRNRFRYARSAVESILSLNNADVEIILQDNSDEQNDVSWANEITSATRFIYNYTPPPLSSIGNFEKAIELSRGEYLCLIGDDDGIIQDLVEAARWASEHDIEAIAYEPVVYMWPGAGIKSTRFTKGIESGLLRIPQIRPFARAIDGIDALCKLLKNGLQYYSFYDVPKLYHGIVKRSFFQDIYNKTGRFIGGLSPDIYSVVNLCCHVQRGIYTNYPLSIAGVCGVSTSADSIKGEHAGDLSHAPHLRHKPDYAWSHKVPRFYSVETIWADSGLAALTDLNRDDLQRRFNVTRMSAYAIWNNRQLRRKFWRSYECMQREQGFGGARAALALAAAVVAGPARVALRRVINRALILLGVNTHLLLGDLRDMTAVMRALEEDHRSREMRIRKVLDGVSQRQTA